MKRATQLEMIERRKKMIQYNKRGVSIKDWVPLLASEYEVSQGAILKDWHKQRSWKKEMINLKEGEKLIQECIADIQDYSKQLKNLIKTTKNDNCKLGAIKQLIESRFKLINFYHSYINEQIMKRLDNLEKIVREKKSKKW